MTVEVIYGAILIAEVRTMTVRESRQYFYFQIAMVIGSLVIMAILLRIAL